MGKYLLSLISSIHETKDFSGQLKRSIMIQFQINVTDRKYSNYVVKVKPEFYIICCKCEVKDVRLVLCSAVQGCRLDERGLYTLPPLDLNSSKHPEGPLNTTKTWFLFASHVKMEKAEILEKTIIYIKKLQEITGKQEPGSESKMDNHQLPNQGTVIIATFYRRTLSLFVLFRVSCIVFSMSIVFNAIWLQGFDYWYCILSYHPLILCVCDQPKCSLWSASADLSGLISICSKYLQAARVIVLMKILERCVLDCVFQEEDAAIQLKTFHWSLIMFGIVRININLRHDSYAYSVT